MKQAEHDAHRVKELAQSPSGIPPAGAVTLLREDPLSQGPKLFAKNCASCHRYDGHDGTGIVPKDKQSAAELKDFASRKWVSGFLNPEQIATAHYFGETKFKDGKMVRFVQKDIARYSPEEKTQLEKAIAALSAEAQLKSQRAIDEKDAALIVEGREAIKTLRCTDCHQFRNTDEEATAPDLTGYGSRDWLVGIISNPKHDRFYRKNHDRMPAFAEDGILDAKQIGLIADWLRGEWYTAQDKANRN